MKIRKKNYNDEYNTTKGIYYRKEKGPSDRTLMLITIKEGD